MSVATRLVLGLLSAVFCALVGVQALARYGSFHNQTYDLALYARQAWGLVHGDYWDPIVGAHFLGSHVSIVLWPLGLLGKHFGTVPVLLVSQALAFALATLPIAHMAARRFGEIGALCAGAIWLLHPNLSHVASYEFHPGSLAILPLTVALDAFDRRRPLGFTVACVAVLACRDDFAFIVVLLALLALHPIREQHDMRIAAVCVALVAAAYLGIQMLVLRPVFWPHVSSVDLHFGRWGGSPFGIVRSLFVDPHGVAAHLLEPKRLLYIPKLLWPLAFWPLLAPRWWLPALPVLAINIISTFPTTLELYSHYLTPAVPLLIVAALDGLAQFVRRYPIRHSAAIGLLTMLALSMLGNQLYGALPWCNEFDAGAFARDARSREAAHIVEAVPNWAGVQAPDPLLAHLAERPRVYRAPPPDHATDYVVLDVTHRARYAQREDLLRTIEEPLVRRWLARRDYGLIVAEPSYLLFAYGHDPRRGVARRYLAGEQANQSGIVLTRCLSVLSAWLDPHGLELELAVQAPCPADLALRIGFQTTPPRVDLLFDGLLSPAQLRDEVVYSWHTLTPIERRHIVERGLRLGAVRANGAPAERGDPTSIPIPLIR